MAGVLLFAGTMEGRRLAEYLDVCRIKSDVFVTTEYGEQLLPKGQHLRILVKSLTEEEMTLQMEEHSYDFVLDATHPFAKEATENIRNACGKTGHTLIRVRREDGSAEGTQEIRVDSIKAAVEYLKQTKGNILITSGSKGLWEFTLLPGYQERCYARVLPSLPVMAQCEAIHIKGEHLICMQGPFGKDMNLAMLRQVKAAYLVTKESGAAGGYGEKLEAAEEAGVIPIIIGRPAEGGGFTVTEAMSLLKRHYGIEKKRKISLVGCGMGSGNLLTLEAEAVLRECQAIVGAPRIIEGLNGFCKETYGTIRNEEIMEYIRTHEEYAHIAVAFSGDLGFLSGAKRLRPLLSEYEVKSFCGIPSPVYFFNKLGIPWEDVMLLSLHGRSEDIIRVVREQEKVFFLLGGEMGVSAICQKLIEHHLDKVHLTVGENLSYEEERILSGTPKELLREEINPLCVIYIENKEAKGRNVSYGMAEEAFIRGKTPMTKSEVRSIVLSKLGLTEHSVLYDVGAGTGSVSVEASGLLRKGRVYALERDAEAVTLLEANKEKFRRDNMIIVKGEAPLCMEPLPAPTHAFVGGTGGNLKPVLEGILNKNKGVRVVVNCLALETLAEMLTLLKELPVTGTNLVQITVSRAKEIGNYRLMTGQNPIYVISFTGKGECCS